MKHKNERFFLFIGTHTRTPQSANPFELKICLLQGKEYSRACKKNLKESVVPAQSKIEPGVSLN